MANRRCLHELRCRATALLSTKLTPSLSSLTPQSHLSFPVSVKTLATTTQHRCLDSSLCGLWNHHYHRHFSSDRRDDEETDGDEDEDDEEISGDEDDDGSSGDEMEAAQSDLNREYTVEEKEAEAAAIGYKVVGPLLRSDRVFKDYEPVFAVIEIGSHQFKVSNGDCIYTERLKFCEVNDKLILNKVLLLGSRTQTIIGRPILPEAAVHAVVEEHALDAKVIIFKKKRRKNYRRTNGHRQELTKLRIYDIQGIEKPEPQLDEKKPIKRTAIKPEKVAVAA